MRSLTYYVGVTIDGFIAAPDGSTEFFPVDQPVLDLIAAQFPETLPTHVRGPLGVTAPGTRFDTVVMGRGTYAPALEAGITSPYAHLRQVVVSTTLPADLDPQVEVVAGDPVSRVRRLKQEPGAGIWLAGGGRLAGALLEEIDELVVKRYPVVLGTGIPLIATDGPRALPFALTGTSTLQGGTTVSTYRRLPGRTPGSSVPGD
ncbi:dihydrofolate reductase family protein [Kineococcus sp. SYSU DK006]|uniref:dihydrofolate reductase family protein n=1 Tax=Kineococcus sp. SYSU DK006 TaxID=3383127 RepID=UPI003D7D5064